MSIYKPEGSLIDTKENRMAMKSPKALYEAFLSGTILEARATVCDSQHNLIVQLDCMQGVIPRVEGALGMDDGSTKDIALISKVGKPVCFVVTGFKRDLAGNEYAVLSRRAVQEDARTHYIKHLRNGDVIGATVTHLEPFGAFVDIACGIPSLIPIDMISVSRISHPKDRFYPGQSIRAVVKSIEDNNRISLSHKELLGTWEQNAAKFNVGETVAGIVRSVEDYGIFVELTPNLAGLAEFCENIKVGQLASVYIKSIIPEKMKIKLIIVDAFDYPQAAPEPVYFFEGNHIDHFVYSTDVCSKIIKTEFL